MARRPALVLARPRPLPGGLVVPWRRWLEIVVAVAAAAVLAYVAARFTPLFAVRELRLDGATPQVTAEVRAALGDVDGRSLVAVDGDAVARRLEELPSVQTASIDKAFPHTLRVFVEPERPVAVLAGGHTRWVVSEAGRVIRRASSQDERQAVIRLDSAPALTPGARLADHDALTALHTLAALPRRFPVRVAGAAAEAESLTLRLAGGAEVRLGGASALALKLEVARRILASLTSDELATLGYVDVSVPARAVTGEATLKSEVER